MWNRSHVLIVVVKAGAQARPLGLKIYNYRDIIGADWKLSLAFDFL